MKEGLCERWCVTKLCVKVVCERRSVKDADVTKFCVKVVCERWCVTKLCCV